MMLYVAVDLHTRHPRFCSRTAGYCLVLQPQAAMPLFPVLAACATTRAEIRQ
jgi:hypothetical protein